MNDFERGYQLGKLIHAKDKLIISASAFRSAVNLITEPAKNSMLCEADHRDIEELAQLVELAVEELRKLMVFFPYKEMA